MLNLKTKEWTEINSGISHGISYHSLTPVSHSQLLLVGGEPGSNLITKRVAMYDIITSEWKEEASLPPQFGGSEGGLKRHQAFATRNETAMSVICVGGYIDGGGKKLTDHMILLNFPIEN